MRARSNDGRTRALLAGAVFALSAQACAPAAPVSDAAPLDARADVSLFDEALFDERDAPALDAASDAPPEASAAPALELRVTAVPENTPAGETLYAAGTFNDWAPGDPRYALTRGPWGSWVVRVPDVTAGQRVEYKITRGAWERVERFDDGTDRPNRATVFDPTHPVTALFVERWADRPAPSHTHGERVRVLRDVAVPQLSRTRDVWVYLPPGYDEGSERFSVVYAYDAQNLFDARFSAFGAEWRLDEALDALAHEGRGPRVLVVALANSPDRPCEYGIFPSDLHPACADGSTRGDATNAFIATVLKPRIDAEYRTLASREGTAIVGSSMGGAMALRAGFVHPTVFARVGALSASYQNDSSHEPPMPAFVRTQRPAMAMRVYQDMGTNEQIRDIGSAVLQRNLFAVRDALAITGIASDALRAEVIEGGTHDERSWSRRVASVMEWVLR